MIKGRLLSRLGGAGAFLVTLVSFTPGITVTHNEAVVTYPEKIVFEIAAHSDSEIESAEIEFSTSQLACGESRKSAFPDDFEPAASIDTDWDWNLRQSGPIPPGTAVLWRWVLTNADGETHTTEEQSVVFADDRYPWQSISTEHLNILWYEGSASFADELMQAGVDALYRLKEFVGIDVKEKVDIYIYASSEDVQSATLFTTDWTGGMAFAEYSTVLIGVSPSSLDWGTRTVMHELAHVVIGHYTFSCFNSLPLWLNEGLAQWTEGEMEPYQAELLAEAIENNSLLSLRELPNSFSNDPDLARQAYAQSQSIVEFMLEEYGQEPMLLLLDEFRNGASEDQALRDVYGLDRDGLDALWREWVGAPPAENEPTPGPTPTHTPYPTIAPIGAAGTSIPADTPEPVSPDTPTQTLEPTPLEEVVTEETPGEPAEDEPDGLPRITIVIVLIAVCLVSLLLVVTIAVMLFLRNRTDKK